MVYILIILMLTQNIYTICADIRVKTGQQIVANLFEGYSPVVKPRLNLSEPVDINLTLHFTSLREIDERLQTMTFIGWIELSWIDEFLILKDGVKSVQLPKSTIWYPDVALFNSIDDPLHISDGEHIVLLEDGRVVWFPGRQYSVICRIDIRRFPFDTQKCQIRLGSWQTPVWVQRIVDTGDSLSDLGYEENGEWEIIDRITQPEYNSNFRISYVIYEIHFRRLCLYPVINTLLPVILLSFLNTLVFLLPANSGEKMTMCISVLLSFTVFLTVFNDMMPQISTTISYLSIYLCVQLAMSGLAVMESIYIWRVNYREKNETIENVHAGSKYNGILLPNPAEGFMFNTQDSSLGEDSIGQLDCTANHIGYISNNNIDDKRASPKRLSLPRFKQTYYITAEGSGRHC
ncbi:neuronal acetylcholine receptor subunit alpha-3-like [Pecten maximus]|uniref:neuronal acetylcholine receptor subunit alpha-3-like n=1 Tax=Pecten maximus TaxID=6579 RepID=UPI0014587A28|nr:neuronal acetylcholine receptor subunit alpha-3-like [Pecten maximus]XP_033730997.1 neuronal acetylcholine receptor subunit alpha-3-like [Pecten maximus]